MKNNQKLLIIVSVLVVAVIGVSFAFFSAGVKINGKGDDNIGTTQEPIKVEYNSGTSALSGTNMLPGNSATKDFSVKITPKGNDKKVTYSIYLNLTSNTFEYCTDTNYAEITNECAKNASELTYKLKDNSGNIIASGDLTGKTGKVELARETKTVESATTFEYVLEITFENLTTDQNHNVNKTLSGELKVEFAEEGYTMDEILAKYNTSTRSDFSVVYTDETTKTVFTASDGLGTSKYFAGAPTDNYVKFGGFYWRIIRMNGDKTTRLIYAGDANVIDGLLNKQNVLANGYDDNSTKYTQIKKSAFNSTSTDNTYVGFKYETGILQGITNKSTILEELDTWYEANLKTGYGKYIDGSTGFCGDRTPYTNTAGTTSGGGTSTTKTYYADYIRLITNRSPVLTCADSSDLYTTNEASRGNKALTNPIGLINANEVAMAGGVWGADNTSYYLRTNNYYWTISPCLFFNGSSYAAVIYVNFSGNIGNSSVDGASGVRPVINLASTTRFTGQGTWDDPFQVVES